MTDYERDRLLLALAEKLVTMRCPKDSNPWAAVLGGQQGEADPETECDACKELRMALECAR